jgi:hypothetical protein
MATSAATAVEAGRRRPRSTAGRAASGPGLMGGNPSQTLIEGEQLRAG